MTDLNDGKVLQKDKNIMLRLIAPLFKSQGICGSRRVILRGKKTKAGKKPRKLRAAVAEDSESTIATKKKIVYNMDDLPKPYFFLNVASDGSTVPGYYTKPLYPRRNYFVRDLDSHNAPLWRKQDSNRVVTNAEDQAIKKIRDKYFS